MIMGLAEQRRIFWNPFEPIHSDSCIQDLEILLEDVQNTHIPDSCGGAGRHALSHHLASIRVMRQTFWTHKCGKGNFRVPGKKEAGVRTWQYEFWS